MRDLVEISLSIDKNLPPKLRRIELCNQILEELKTLKGSDTLFIRVSI